MAIRDLVLDGIRPGFKVSLTKALSEGGPYQYRVTIQLPYNTDSKDYYGATQDEAWAKAAEALRLS